VQRPLWRVGLAAALLAAAANVVVYVVARGLGVPLEITEIFAEHFARIPVQSFVFGTLIDGGIVGTALAYACRAWAPHPQTWFVVLAVLGTVGSLALPILSDGTTATKVLLCVSHVVAAVILVPALAAALRRGNASIDGARDQLADVDYPTAT
jgi:hypothetical protein